MPSDRAIAVAAAVKAFVPLAPAKDRAAIVEHATTTRSLRRLAPEAAAWLSIVAYIRHNLTEYEALLDDGYGVEAARHFTTEPINQALAHWGATRRIGAADEES